MARTRPAAKHAAPEPTPDPMNTPNPKEQPCPHCNKHHPKCRAHNRSRNPCGKDREPGAAVCRMHGGAAPQVIARAKQRLLEALDPAAAELVRIARGQSKRTVVTKDGEEVEVGPSHAVQVRAIEAIMDRAGLPAKTEIEGTLGVTLADEAREALRKTFPMDKEREAS